MGWTVAIDSEPVIPDCFLSAAERSEPVRWQPSFYHMPHQIREEPVLLLCTPSQISRQFLVGCETGQRSWWVFVPTWVVVAR